MASSTSKARGRQAAATRQRPVGDAEATRQDGSLDGVIDGWSERAAKEQVALEIAACSALLRGAEALREAQLDTAQRAQQAHEQAAARLQEARGMKDIAEVQLALARADLEGALQYWGRLGAIASRSGLELWAESAEGLARLQGAAWNAAQQWSRRQASMPQNEALEAEVDHVTSPLAASPLVWPAQEATRQAMTLAASTWNDWLSWSGQMAGAAGGNGSGAARSAH